MNLFINTSRKSSVLVTLLILPFYSLAEAGKGITDEAIFLAFGGVIIILLNQIYLTITSIRKILNPEKKLSILHYITLVISLVILLIYLPNKSYNSPIFFDMSTFFPFFLGIISLVITLSKLVTNKPMK